MHTKGLHDFFIRKRIHKKGEHFPPRNKWKRFMDKAIYVIGILGPLFTIPQLLKIWVEKNAAGVSAISWAGYIVAGAFWLTYGIMHKEKPIIVTYILWIILEILIVIGALIYG